MKDVKITSIMKKALKPAMKAKAASGSSSSGESNEEVSWNTFLSFPPSDQGGRHLSFCASVIKARAFCSVALQERAQFACDTCIAAFLNSVCGVVIARHDHLLLVLDCDIYTFLASDVSSCVLSVFICAEKVRLMIGCVSRVYFHCACTFDGCGASTYQWRAE